MYKGLPAEEELYREVVDLGLKAGAKMLFAKVNAVLFIEPKAIPLEELAQKTGYSLASVSGAVKQLETIKHVRKVKMTGSKRVYVQGEKNLIKTLHDHFSTTIQTALKPMQTIMPPVIQELKQASKDQKTSKEKKEDLKAKIAWYEEYLYQNAKIIDLFATIEERFKKLEQERRQLP